MELSGQLDSTTLNTTVYSSALPAAQAQSDLSSTLRSFRDSLAFSFQTLNLTLASMSQTMANVGTKIGSAMASNSNQLAPINVASQWIPRGPGGLYNGSLSQAYQQYAGSNNLMNIMASNQQYNVNPNEFWSERKTDMALRGSSAGVATVGALAKEAAGMLVGAKAGGAIGGAMGMGTGMLGSLGRFAVGLPFGAAAGAAVDLLVDPIVEASVRHNNDVAAMMRMSARFRSPFTMKEAQRAVGGIENLAYEELFRTSHLEPRLNMSGFRDITMMGLQGNMFQGETPEELVKQVSAASNVVKFLTGVLGSKDVQETMQVVKQLKDMGLNSFRNTGAIQSIGTDAFSYGRALGVQANTLLSTAASMSSVAFGQYGNPAFVGIHPALRNLAYTTELEKRRMLTPAEIAAGGGVQAMAGKMLSTQANLLNNGAIGGAMLYAGWDGQAGFNLEKYKATIENGGYWGAVGQAAKNITTGGLGSIAMSIAEKNNIIASAAEKGDLDKLLEIQLRSELKNILGMLPKNASLEQKVAFAAVHLTQISPGLDISTAKAIALKVLNPRIQAGIDRTAKEEYQIGSLEYARAGRGFGRFVDTIGENIERNLGSLHQTFIERPARSIADAASNALDTSYRTSTAIQKPLEGADLQLYYSAVKDLQKSNYKPDETAMFSNADRLEALDRIDKRGTLGDAFTGGWKSFLRFNRRLAQQDGIPTGDTKDYNFLADVTWLGAKDSMANYWNQVAGEDKISALEGRMMIQKYSDASLTHKDLERYFNVKGNENPLLPYIGMGKWFDEHAGGAYKDEARSRLSEISSKLSTSDIDAIRGNNLTWDQKNMTADKAFEILKTSNSRDIAAQIAKGMKLEDGSSVTADQVLAATSHAMFGHGSGTGIVAAVAHKDYQDILRGSQGYISKDNISKLIGPEGMAGIDVNGDTAMKALNDIGIDRKRLETLFKNLHSSDEIDAFLEAYTDISNGEVDPSKIRNINTFSQNPEIMALLGDEMDNVSKNGKKRFKVDYTGKDYANKVKAGGVSLWNQNIDAKVADFGISGKTQSQISSMTNAEAQRFLDQGGFTAHNSTAAAFLKRADELKNLSNEELEDRLGHKRGTITDQNRALTIVQDTMLAAAREGSGVQQKRQDAGQVMKTAVDTAIEPGKDGKNWLRVRVVSDTEIKDARESVEKNTDKPTKPENKGTLADQQKPNFIQKWIKDIFHTN